MYTICVLVCDGVCVFADFTILTKCMTQKRSYMNNRTCTQRTWNGSYHTHTIISCEIFKNLKIIRLKTQAIHNIAPHHSQFDFSLTFEFTFTFACNIQISFQKIVLQWHSVCCCCGCDCATWRQQQAGARFNCHFQWETLENAKTYNTQQTNNTKARNTTVLIDSKCQVDDDINKWYNTHTFSPSLYITLYCTTLTQNPCM